jgi:hypothetical protein
MNQFQPGVRDRKPAVLGRGIIDPAGWSKDEFQSQEKYVYTLSESQVSELFGACDRFERTGDDLSVLSKEKFRLPDFGATLEDVINDEVLNGRGFVFLRGLPIDGRSVRQNAIIQWGVASYLGQMLPQTKHGHLLEHVKDAGGNIHSPTGRGYNSANTLGFHSDDADAFSLMCLRTGKSGGEHRIVSSVTVYNAMLDRYPQFAKELEFHFYRSRRGEIPDDEVPWVRQPVFSVTDGFFCARGASSTVKRAQEIPGVPKLSEAQRDAIACYQKLCGELSLRIDWQPGDISLVLNHVALHARTAYEDWPEPERKRHLLRLWINLDKKRPVHASIAEDMSGIKLPPGTIPSAPLEMTPVN